MRIAALSFLALTITACGGVSGNGEKRVALPLEAPEGAHRLVADFVDICSLYLVDRDQSMQLAKSRGWSNDDTGGDMAAMFTGMAVFMDEQSDANLQMMPSVFPHLEAKTCMLFTSSFDDKASEIDLSAIHSVEGLQGGFMPLPGAGAKGIGRWSFIGPNGEPVTIQAMRPTDSLTQIHMTTTNRLYPK